MIAIDCRYWRERPSGITPYVQALVAHLPELLPEQHFVLLKHPKGPERMSLAPNVHEIVVPYEANGPATMWALSKVVDLRGVRLYHGTFNIMPAGLPMPSIITLHDVMWLKHPEWARAPGIHGRIETLFYRHGIERTLAKATRILTISKATRDEIRDVAPDAIERVRVMRFAIGDHWKPAGDAADRALADEMRRKWVPGAGRYVLTVGQYSPYKNHPMVVRAFARVVAQSAAMSDVHLVLVQRLGEGSRSLGAIARELGIGDRVHFVKSIPFEELRALYWGASVLCHPSLYEGFGNPPAEALATGCPVVTANRSSMPEVSGGAGILVDPESVDAIADALRTVLSDEALAADMRARGFEKVKQLRWRPVMEATASAYREVLT